MVSRLDVEFMEARARASEADAAAAASAVEGERLRFEQAKYVERKRVEGNQFARIALDHAERRELLWQQMGRPTGRSYNGYGGR